MIEKNTEALNLSNTLKRGSEMASSTSDGSSAKPASSSSRQFGRVNRIILDKNSDEYKKRRERNNQAVKKSRNKSKARTQETMQRVNELKEENERLETKVKILTKELSFLKDLFLAHSAAHKDGNQLELNHYAINQNGSHEAVNTNAPINPINSNIISSTNLNSTTIDCNSVTLLQEDNAQFKLGKSSFTKNHDNTK